MRAISGTVDLGIMVPGHVSNPETKFKWIDGGQQIGFRCNIISAG
jgi:hypothetical protein